VTYDLDLQILPTKGQEKQQAEKLGQKSFSSKVIIQMKTQT